MYSKVSYGHVTVYHYNDTWLTLTRWSFDNDKRHVTAFRPISEAAHSWSFDNLSCSLSKRCCPVLTILLKILHGTWQWNARSFSHSWPVVLLYCHAKHNTKKNSILSLKQDARQSPTLARPAAPLAACVQRIGCTYYCTLTHLPNVTILWKKTNKNWLP